MATNPLPRLANASLLIVYVNSTVGVALAQRLFDASEVSIAPVAEAIDVLRGGSRHDVVMLCPYLAADERHALLAACDSRTPAPTVLEVADSVEPPGPHVRMIRASSFDANRVLAALALPLAA